MDIKQRFALMVSEIPDLSYDSKNPHFKNEYLSLQGLLKAVKPTLQKHEFIVVQPLSYDGEFTILTTMFIHLPTGDNYIASQSLLPVYEKGQDYGSRLTYTRRYDLISALGQAPDKDDDLGDQSKSSVPTVRKLRR